MGKTISLTDDLMDTLPTPPLAATPKAGAKSAPAAPTPIKVKKVPLQILVTPEDAKAIKRAALEADQSYSDFMISCFHKTMKP